MIQLRNVTLDLGPTKIFEDISCVFQSDDKVGIIGRNGAGKSTLLKIIAGQIAPTSGQVSIEKDARIAYLPQEEILASALTVFDEAFSAFADIFETDNKIQELDSILAQGNCTHEMLEEYAELQAQAQVLDRHTALQKTDEVLVGLGFTPAMIKKSVSELSTGWKMRLALAKLLLTDADIFLFDEPTNHLDIVTQQWFLQKLQSMRQGFLLVSHDRTYLEKVCTCILEIERGHATYYRGNLQAYLQEKQAQQDIARTTRSRQEREIAQKQAIVDRFRVTASRARQAQSLIKQIDRIELVDVEPPLPTVVFNFQIPQKPGEIILNFNNLAYEFNGITLFSSISGEIQRGERVALIAANGVGKTTLINCLAGIYVPRSGTIKFGHNVKTAFFEQDQANALEPKKTVFQEVCDACPQQTEATIRKILGAFLFSGDDVYKKISVLSGGEKNRVAMTKILLQNANFLILDEPTNHLDLYAKDVLKQALLSYQGTILFVSHDVDFVSKVATRIIELTPTSARSYPGTYEDFLALKQLQSPVIAKASKAPMANSSQKTEIQLLRRQIIDVEREINKLEREEQRITDTVANCLYGSEKYSVSVKRLLEIQKLLEKVHSDWESAIQKLDAARR